MNENNLDLDLTGELYENEELYEEYDEEEEASGSRDFDEMAHFRCMLPY